MKVTLCAYTSFHIIADNSVLNDLFNLLLKYDENNLLLRLYKKVVKQEDLDATIGLLKQIQKNFRGNQKKILEKIINAYEYLLELLQLRMKKGKNYSPIKFVLLDIPYSVLDRNIPLEDYENNEGEPFWMRPQYILEHYSQTYGNYKYKD